MHFTTVTVDCLAAAQTRAVVEALEAIRLQLIRAAPARRALRSAALIDELSRDVKILHTLIDLLEAMIVSIAVNPSELLIAGTRGFSHAEKIRDGNANMRSCGAHWLH